MILKYVPIYQSTASSIKIGQISTIMQRVIIIVVKCLISVLNWLFLIYNNQVNIASCTKSMLGS